MFFFGGVVVFRFVLFFVLLCARNCATFRKILLFFLVFSFVFFLCCFVLGIVLLFGNSYAFLIFNFVCVFAALCSELCYFSEILVLFLYLDFNF